MKLRLVMFAHALVLSVAINGLTPSVAVAQASAPTTPVGVPAFARAIEGKNVWISADGARVSGRVTSLTLEGLVLVEDGVPTTIDYKSIVRVEKSTHRLRNGTLIGLASGAGLGAAVAAAYCSDDYCYPGDVLLLTGFYAGLGAAVGVGIGAIIHAAKKGGDVLYDARRSTTTMSFAPILSRTRKGAAFSVTWR